MYRDASIGCSAVKKWVFRTKSESSGVNPGNSGRGEELIPDDRRATIDDIANRLGISHGSAAKIVGKPGFAKACARWVAKLTDAHKQSRLETGLELLESHADDETFLKRIVTGDETGSIFLDH